MGTRLRLSPLNKNKTSFLYLNLLIFTKLNKEKQKTNFFYLTNFVWQNNKKIIPLRFQQKLPKYGE